MRKEELLPTRDCTVRLATALGKLYSHSTIQLVLYRTAVIHPGIITLYIPHT